MDLTLFLFSCDSQCHLDVSNWLSFVQLLFADWLVFDGLHSICSDLDPLVEVQLDQGTICIIKKGQRNLQS